MATRPLVVLVSPVSVSVVSVGGGLLVGDTCVHLCVSCCVWVC